MKKILGFTIALLTLLPFANISYVQAAGQANPVLSNLGDNTALDLGVYTCIPQAGSNQPCREITDYSRFTYDSDHHQMLMFGGGHASTFRDDVDVFNFSTLKWGSAYTSTPCSQMIESNLNRTTGRWISTGHALARHTYDMLIYAPNVGKLIMLVGVVGRGDCISLTGSDFFDHTILQYDPVSKLWSNTVAQTGSWYYASSAEYDPVSGKIVIVDAQGWSTWIYDPVAQTKTKILELSIMPGSYADNLVYFPPNQKMYLIGRGSPTRVWEVTLNQTNWAATVIVQVTGMTGNIPNSQESGWAYDSVNQIIGGGILNGIFYAYNPLTKNWVAKTMQVQSSAGATPNTSDFHALDYDPVDNVFIWIDYLSGTRTWAYRYKGGMPLLKGDINKDSSIDILDVQALVNHILGIQDYGSSADVNSDSSVDVLDVQEVVNIILG